MDGDQLNLIISNPTLITYINISKMKIQMFFSGDFNGHSQYWCLIIIYDIYDIYVHNIGGQMVTKHPKAKR